MTKEKNEKKIKIYKIVKNQIAMPARFADTLFFINIWQSG